MSDVLEISGPAKLTVRISGKEYGLLKPTRKQAKAIDEKLKTDEGKEQALDIIGDFLVDAGLPKEIAEDMQIEHMRLIFEHLIGVKKN